MKKITFVIFLITIVGCSTSFITGCQFKTLSQNKTDYQEKIKIGFVGPLTGELANMGIPARQAVEMAIEEINQAGGIDGRPIELFVEDDVCDPKGGSLAGHKLIGTNRVAAIIGPLCSGATLTMAPLAEQNKVVLISYASSNPRISDAGDYIFRDFPSDTFQGKFAADFIYRQLNLDKVAILNCAEDYCVGVKDVFEKNFVNYGGQIISQEQFTSETKDFRSPIAKVKNSSAQLIYAPVQTDATINLLKQARELGLNLPLFGAEVWDDPTILRETGKSAENILWTTTRLDIPQWFKDKMRQRYGLAEVPNYTPQAYDAVNILAMVMRKVGTNPENIKNELYNVKNYQGVSGLISFDHSGDLQNAEYIVKTIKDGKIVEYR